MPLITTASAGLVTALKNSLADSGDGWSVLSVIVVSTTYTDYNLSGDPPALSGTSIPTETMTVTLMASALTITVDSAAPMVLAYQSIWINDSYDSGRIIADGATFKTTDSALDTTVRGLATTFLADKDESLTDALEAAASTLDVIPADVLTALKASLADSAAGWAVRAVVKTPISLPATSGTATYVTDVSVGLVASGVVMPASSSLPAQVNYVARLDTTGALIEARVLMSGAQWRTKDSALHSTIMALAAAWLSDQEDAILEALE